MAEVVWTRPALEDLRQIHQFIARDSRQYAAITVRRLRQGVSRLGDFPTSGRVVTEFPDGPYREVLMDSYRIVYRYMQERNRVLVLAVVHGSRFLPAILETR